MSAADSASTRSLRLPSSSPSVKRLPSMRRTTPWGDELAGGVDDAADEALRVDRRGDGAVRVEASQLAALERPGQAVEVPPRQAVDHRHHRGVRAEEVLQPGQDVAHLVRLDREEHGVLRARILRVLHRAHGRGVILAAVRWTSRKPPAWMACRLRLRAMKVTSSPASDSFVPR
jgi:hypothetical protein